MYMRFLRRKTDFLVEYSAEKPSPNATGTGSVHRLGTAMFSCLNDPAYLQNSFLTEYTAVSAEESLLAHAALYGTVSFLFMADDLSKNAFLEAVSDSPIMYKFPPDVLNCSLDKGEIPAFEVLHRRPCKPRDNGLNSAHRVEIASSHTHNRGQKLAFETPCHPQEIDGDLTQIFQVNSVQEALALEFLKYCQALADGLARPLAICQHCQKVFFAD